MAENDKRLTYATIDEACQAAFAVEDGYGDAATNADRYRVFRDGFFAGWIAAQKLTVTVLVEGKAAHG